MENNQKSGQELEKMNFEDKELECIDCHHNFTFTAGEAEFFHKKEFQTPKRCVTCRKKKSTMMKGPRK